MVALASTTDLEARMGRPLAPGEYPRAEALLDDASALVRDYTNQDFSRTDNDTAVLRAQQGEIRLPQRPVLGVTSVVAVGSGGAPDLPMIGWEWDGLDIVRTLTISPVINLPEVWIEDDLDAYPGTYRVVYSHGAAAVPAAVVAVVAAMALRTLTAPSIMGGVTGETVGPYSYRTDGTGVGTAVTMIDSDRRALVRYRHTSGMSMVRFR